MTSKSPLLPDIVYWSHTRVCYIKEHFEDGCVEVNVITGLILGTNPANKLKSQNVSGLFLVCIEQLIFKESANVF